MCGCQNSNYHPAQRFYNPSRRLRKGLGQTSTQIGISAGGATAGVIAGAIIGGPLGAAIGGTISIAASAISSLFTPDYSKIYASNDANEIASLLQENLNGWNALPQSSRVAGVQEYFIQNYLTLWGSLVQYCSNPTLGTAGQKCISDRSPNGPYPWDQYYLNPIQNSNLVPQTVPVTFIDPLTGLKVTVTPSAVAVSTASAVTGILSNDLGFQVNITDLWVLGGGLVLLALL